MIKNTVVRGQGAGVSVKAFFFLLVTIYCSLFTAVNAADVNDTVKRIQNKYSEIHDIQGVFYQTSHLKDLDRTEKYSGKFYIKKPSRLKWIYSTPRDEEVLIRQNEVWFYKKSEKQVVKSRFSKEAYSQVPIAMLESLGNLEADYEIKMTAEDTLELVPVDDPLVISMPASDCGIHPGHEHMDARIDDHISLQEIVQKEAS